MFELIDFDRAYSAFAEQWMTDNRKRFSNMDEMEAQLPQMFLRWLNTPADFIGGEMPGTFFSKYDDPQYLIDWLRAYDDGGVPIPDLLIERIAEIGEESVRPLIHLASDDNAKNELRITALNVLLELNAKEAKPLCLELVLCREHEDELADAAADLLESLGSYAVPDMISLLKDASSDALCTFLDLLCNFPGDERIYIYAVNEFEGGEVDRALYASYLAKLGDARAIEPLMRSLRLPELNYLEYIEIRNAIEALGGEETIPERDFSGDPYYESMKRM